MLTFSAPWSMVAKVSDSLPQFTEILQSTAVIGSIAAHYILEKDVFLIATGMAYPASETGISIWQMIGNIGEDKRIELNISESTVTHESSQGWISLQRFVVLVIGIIVILLPAIKSL